MDLPVSEHVSTEAPVVEVVGRRSPVLDNLLRNRAAVAATVFLFLLVLVAAFAPLVAPQDPSAQDLAHKLSSPSSEHWLGTDSFGRDVLSRLIFAARTTLLATAEGVGIAVLMGIPLGLLAGLTGGWLDAVLSRIVDTLLSLPPLILALAIIGILGPGLTNAMLAVGVVYAPRFYRVARGAAQSVRNETYIEAARSIGCPTRRILVRHVLPNASGPLLVQVTFSLGLMIIAEASLSFLGLGVQPPTASWGSMTREAFATMTVNPFPVYPPVVMIVLTILAFSVLGDGLRDATSGNTPTR